MLVSGGQILAIDKVNAGNTILGDGVQKPLYVNTDLIATTSSVSSISAALEQNIDYVSGHLPVVTAGKNIGVEVSATPDGRPLYIVSTDDIIQSEIRIIGDNGVSAAYNNTTSSWNIGVSAQYLSANALEDYYNKTQIDNKLTATSSWANETFQQIGEYISASEKFLSANALDKLSANWNEASAFGANSGKFVTSAGFEFENNLAYFLKKQEDESMAWSGVDLSDLGKIYPISSLTPNLISATVSSVDGTPTYILSAVEQEQIATPDISGYGLSAWKDTEQDKYFVSANIVGNHGVFAEYDAESNTWNLGLSANDYSFLFGSYVNSDTVTDGTILKLESNNKHLIDIDEYGYITLPSTTNKFTFCINEYVDDNTTENHEYLLNKLVLSAKNNDSLVTSQNYYPAEVGSSNVTIAITIDNTAATDREFCIVYKGSDVGANKLHINASIIEEVTSLDSTAGAVDDYTGINPIYVVDNDRKIGLDYDETVFKLINDSVLGRKKLTIDAGSETVDAQKFEKMATLIDTRITETFPIGIVCDEGTIGSNTCVSYMFRPNMTYDCTSATSAYIYNGTVDANQAYARIGIYELGSTSAKLVWKSALTCLNSNSQNTFSAASDTITGAISTDKLYYACILTNNKQINNVLGINGNGTADVGNPKPWCTVNNINSNGSPFANTDFSTSVAFAGFGSFTSTIKPYIGLRGSAQ